MIKQLSLEKYAKKFDLTLLTDSNGEYRPLLLLERVMPLYIPGEGDISLEFYRSLTIRKYEEILKYTRNILHLEGTSFPLCGLALHYTFHQSRKKDLSVDFPVIDRIVCDALAPVAKFPRNDHGGAIKSIASFIGKPTKRVMGTWFSLKVYSKTSSRHNPNDAFTTKERDSILKGKNAFLDDYFTLDDKDLLKEVL